MYRLLGLSPFESDRDVIRTAAERQMSHVRRLARGEFVTIGQALLNELAEAKLTLINDESRMVYDDKLLATDKSLEDGRQTLNEHDTAAQTLAASLQNDAAKNEQSDALAEQRPSAKSNSTPQIGASQISTSQLTTTSVDDCRVKLDQSQQIGRTEWVLGYHEDCDIRVDYDVVSRVHCRVSIDEGQVFVSDLMSANGTYVNQTRIQKTTPLAPFDLLTLSKKHRIILPDWIFAGAAEKATKAVYVGRELGNDVRFQSRRVSRFHARIVSDGSSYYVQDLFSKHGTGIDRGEAKPTRVDRADLKPGDIIKFGDVTCPVKFFYDVLGNTK